MTYRNRSHAGQALAQALAEAGLGPDPVVLGLPRGGVPVAAEVATALGAPLDVIVVRKLGIPGHEEVAMGALGEGGMRVLDDALVGFAGVTDDQLAAVELRERAVIDDRVLTLRGGRVPLELRDRTAVIVDDGIATGATARAAVLVARELGAASVVVAAPVGADDSIAALREVADAVVVPLIPPSFRAVGLHYDRFDQTPDAEVERLLRAQPPVE